MTELHEQSAVAIAAAVRAGEVSVEEVATACLEAVVRDEEDLCAWAHLDPELVLAQARTLDALDTALGPLHGVPVGIKDIIDTADQPTAYGSPIYAAHRPQRDALVVARLRAAGAVILGKTVTTEFALFHPGPTVNPHDASRTPGGSSSGSAAAVGARDLPLALGTQTAGSIVRPASFCGVLGAKPTFGAVPTDGVKPCSPSLDTVGVFARGVDDAALALGVMAGDRGRFAPADLGQRPRLGFTRTFEWDRIEAVDRALLEGAVDRLADHLDVVEVDMPADFAGLVEAQVVVMGVEVTRALAAERRAHEAQLSERLREVLADGDRRAWAYDGAMEHLSGCRERVHELFADVDVLLAPSTLGEAPPLELGTGDPLLCRGWTALGTPAISVPGLAGPAGLPVGMQVVAPRGRDDLALGGARRVGSLLAESQRGRP